MLLRARLKKGEGMMKEETHYMVGIVKKEHPVNVFGSEVTLPLTWADGMIGVMPVFENYESAETYAKGKAVYEISTKNPTD